MSTQFVVSDFETIYRQFATRVLRYTLLLLLTIVSVFLVVSLLGGRSSIQRIFIPIVMSVFAVSFFLTERKRFTSASLLFLGGFWLVITAAVFSINGIRNASFSAYVVIIIYSAVLLGGRAVAVFTGISVLSGILVTLGELQGVLPLRRTELFIEDRIFMHTGIFMASAILLYFTSQILREGMQRVQEGEERLLARNEALVKEIADRKEVEARLREHQDQYRILFENTGVPTALYDRHNRVTMMNDAGAHLFNLTPEQCRGLGLYDLFTKEIADRATERHTRILQTGKAEVFESVTNLPVGEVTFLMNMQPLRDDRGEIIGILLIATDITEQRRAQQRELELAIANEKNAFLTDFLGTVSHDLKTPITVLNTSLYLIENSQDRGYQQRKLEVMKEQTGLLDRYIQDMLMVARLEHAPTMTPEAVPLEEVFREVTGRLRARAERKQIEMDITDLKTLPAVQGDADQLQRALINLVENALTYTPVAGHVRLCASQEGNTVMIEVSDSGIGIAPEDLPHIFERFYRSEPARRMEHSGTGLGLAIVKKVIDMHQGTIEVESQPGQGTTFRIRLEAAPMVAEV
ncbi:MAG: ATP-binding protein [bacterium]|nr:ATP-binding protein [bacterium]